MVMETAAVSALAKGAVAAAPVAIPLFSRAVQEIKGYWHSYGSEQLEEIKLIQNHWKRCYQQEKDNDDLSTLSIGHIITPAQDAKTGADNVKFPIYLEMLEDKKVPVLFEKAFVPMPYIAEWYSYLKSGFFRHAAEEMIGYICEYQRLRSERLFGKGYSYDPTNLFFEEFKAWLTKLSGVNLKKEILSIIMNRISYLDAIRNDSKLFTAKEDQPTRKQIIKRLQELLQTIVPTLEDQIQRVSAREDFELLKSHTVFILRNGIKFLYYAFREQPGTPNFLIEEIRSPQLPSYQKSLHERYTILDKILQYLLNSPQFLVIFPKFNQDNALIEFSTTQLLKNSFIGQDNLVNFPLEEIKEKKQSHWITYEDSKNKIYSGFFLKFRQQELGNAFLSVCGQLQEICIFYLIINEIRGLAEDGGNLLIYKYAASEVLGVLDEFLQLTERFKKETETLRNAGQKHKDFLDSNPKKVTNEDRQWGMSHGVASDSIKECLKQVSQAEILIGKMKENHKKVVSKEYNENIATRIAFLLKLMNYFCRRDEKKELQAASISTNKSLFMPSPKQDKKEKLSKEEFEHLVKEAKDFSENKNFKGAWNIYQKLMSADPKNIDILSQAALCLCSLGVYGKSLDLVNHILTLDKNNEGALFLKASLLDTLGQLKPAIDTLDILIDLNSNYKSAIALRNELIEKKQKAFELTQGNTGPSEEKTEIRIEIRK